MQALQGSPVLHPGGGRSRVQAGQEYQPLAPQHHAAPSCSSVLVGIVFVAMRVEGQREKVIIFYMVICSSVRAQRGTHENSHQIDSSC